MDFETKMNSILLNDSQNTDDHIDIRGIIDKYLYHWKWILLGIILSLGIAFWYLRYTSNEYQASTSIIIDNQENGGASELAAFQDLGAFGGSQNPLENEIGILKSLTLMEKVVKNLQLNVTYYDASKKANGELYRRDFPLKINFFIPDSVFYQIDTSFIIIPKSKSEYLITDEENNFSGKGVFGKNLKTTFGSINITPKNNEKLQLGKPFKVQIIPLEGIVNFYRKKIEIIAPEDMKSSLLVLALESPVLQKSKDVLDNLVKQYNEDAIFYRSQITESTDRFINKRIEDISNELSIADRGVEDFKTKNRLTDMAFESSLILSSNSELEKRIVDLNSQMKLIEYVMDYIDSSSNQLIPSNMGLNDPSTSRNTAMYNQLMMEKKRIMKSSSKLNPTVINLEEQITTLRNSIKQSLLNLKSSLSFSLSEARSQESRLNSKRYMAPKQERQIQDIQRKQQTIETLYLYLLQKREENAIKLGATSPNAKIIDKANGSHHPISPSKKKTYLLAFLVGMILPIIAIFLITALDSKIHTVEDVESVIKAPILGDVPKSKMNPKKLISSNDNDALAESFRILRTNLNYMLSGKNKDCKTIFVTSTIAGEGKTITTLNLASTLVSINKKVIVIGADLRKPKFFEYLDIQKKGIGLTHYLVDDFIKISDIIITDKKYNFDLINSWEIPPNPSDLLTNGRFEKILEYAKAHYDYILVDTAPIGLVADTMLLNHHADLLLYIIRANYLDKRLLKIPQKLYENNRLQNMAIIVNATNYKKSGYGYGYGYGS